ncbi:retrovirus-related pol polyprotein from transposon TNT 1-94 [Tanacetum coccineum]|uniref:Retrovirus-related pol polyprotein from transposon TNT 1-94 n=1 Tax=Tanacetum coccineum TaxID=301880 RepID=A0ABQ5DVJ0_9ASTR
MTTLAEFMIIIGTDNHPSMLEKSLYDSCKSRMEFYMENMTYAELSASEKLQADCDCKATNIVLQGLPPDVYAIVNHHKVAKEIWDRVKLLMQGTKLSLQEKECKLYDEFNNFTFVKGETLYHLLPEWSKLVIDVKLLRDLHTTNYDQLYKGNATSSGGNNVRGQARVIKCYNCQGEGHMARQFTQPSLGMLTWIKGKAKIGYTHEAGQILDEEKLAFLADPSIPES